MKPTALILGASSGMGYATAEKLAGQGYDLVLVYRARRAEVGPLEAQFDSWRADGIRVWQYNRDALRDEVIADILREVQENGLQISFFLHSLARGHLKPMLASAGEEGSGALSTEDMALTLQAMASSYHQWAAALIRKNTLAPRASLWALTSEGARRAWPGYGAVAAAKAALEAINRQLALELAPMGHRSNILQPGITDTPALRMIPGSEKMLEHARQRNPYQQLTRPEYIADALFALSQVEAHWINGAVIPVDGGESIA